MFAEIISKALCLSYNDTLSNKRFRKFDIVQSSVFCVVFCSRSLFVLFHLTIALSVLHRGRVRIPLMERCTDTTLCDKVRQLLVTCRWFSAGIPVSSTNKTDRHDITEILLKVALNTINHYCLVCSLSFDYFIVCPSSIYIVRLLY